MANKDLRIMLAGCSGIGKTTLAKKLSELYDIPFVSGSYSDLVPETRNMPHTDMIQQDTKKVMEQDYQLLNLRSKQCRQNINFVTDRSPFDSAAYWINKLAHRAPECETEQFLETCKLVLEKECSHLIYIPFTTEYIKDWQMEDNKKRVMNRYYQFEMTTIMDGILELWGYRDYMFTDGIGYMVMNNQKVKTLILQSMDFDTRVKMVQSFLRR